MTMGVGMETTANINCTDFRCRDYGSGAARLQIEPNCGVVLNARARRTAISFLTALRPAILASDRGQQSWPAIMASNHGMHRLARGADVISNQSIVNKA